ncbi:unnamed protein product [Closterium sp. NIES-53]
MTTLRVLLHVAAQRDYELHSLDFSTAFLQGSLHEEIWLRRPPGFTGSFPPGTQWSLLRPVYGLRQAPREWHDTLRTTLAALGFAPSTADPSLFLRTDTSLPPFYVLVYVDDLVFATADTAGLAHVNRGEWFKHLLLPSISGLSLVDQFTPASQRVTHCTCARTGRHLATFTRRPGSSLYTLSTESPSVSASGQVAASSQVLAAVSGSGPESAPCSCRLLSHQTLLWHHRLGHPSLPRLRGMASRVLVSGLPV